MSSVEKNPIGFIRGLIQVLPSIYYQLGFNSKVTREIRDVVDSMIDLQLVTENRRK